MKSRMPMRTNPVVIALILLVTIVFCFVLWFFRSQYISNKYEYKWAIASTGAWNVSEFDFEDGYLMLRGDVFHIENELLTPEEFEQREDEAVLGELNSTSSTSKIIIEFADNSTYMIAMQSLGYAERIYINGELRQEVGIPATEEEQSIPGKQLVYFEIQPIDGRVEIVRQTSNFVHQINGEEEGIYVSTPEVLKHFVTVQTDMTALFAGVFLAIFIVHMLLYMLVNTYPSNIYFALLCLAWAVRTMVENPSIVASWLPELPWEVIFKADYVSDPIAVMLLILIISWEFPKALPRWFVVLFAEIFGAYSVFCIVCPPYELSYTQIGFQIAYFVTIVFVIIVMMIRFPKFVRAGKIHTEHWVFMGGSLFYMLCVAHDEFAYYGLDPLGITFPVEDFSLLVFSVISMAAFFRATMRVMDSVKQKERESVEEAKTLRRINDSKEDFLGSLSHELKVPIAAVSSLAQLSGDMADDEVVPRELVKDNMRRIVDEADRMERMVMQLLDTVALDSGNFRIHMGTLDVKWMFNVLEEQYFPIMNKGDNTLNTMMDEYVQYIEADGERILQVLINLLSNSVKHTVNGTVTISCYAEEEFAVFTVADTGNGISPELLPQLFERFPENKNPTGTGLGLYICKKIVEAHGGIIEINSNEGEGTTVRFCLPLFQERE